MSVGVVELIAYGKSVPLNTANETQLRSVVSRAYYAAYHDCVQWHVTLKSPGSVGASDGGVHSQLIAQLSLPTVKGDEVLKSKKRGYLLKALKLKRTKADYHLSEDLVADEAAQALVDAEAIISIL
jgi:uncharacterized protein (UPF0332 family)